MKYILNGRIRADLVLGGDAEAILRFVTAAKAALGDGFSLRDRTLTDFSAEVETMLSADGLRAYLFTLDSAAAGGMEFDILPEKAPASAIERIDALVGSPEYKRLMHELYSVAPLTRKHATFDVFSCRCYLFSIGAGRGLTTALELFADLLYETGLFRFGEGRRVREAVLPAEEKNEGELCELVTEGFGRGHVICVDIGEWTDRLYDGAFRRFLAKIEDYATDNIVVFRVPFLEDDALEALRRSLGDILTVRAVSFEPLSPAELRECARRSLAAVGYGMTDNAWAAYDALIEREKSDGAFYGINTVNKVVREMIYAKQVYDAADGTDDCIIKTEELSALCAAAEYDARSGDAILDSLVGMEQVRARIEEIAAQIEYAKQSGIERPTLHMRFVGGPGTGKTTVARALGKLFKERGILRRGAFFERSARDLCGKYVGQTAPRTAEICRDAYGSVLFIDEAYALYKGDRESDPFGMEAVDTLIAEMENHRGDLVVIMAGYPDEMETLMQANPGLESRMPYVIEFPNYDRNALYRIFMRFCEGKFTLGEGFAEAVRDYFDALPQAVLDGKNFSNARFVRNLFERTYGKATMRTRLEGGSVPTLTKEDFRLAGSDREFAGMMAKKTNKMGFTL